MKSKTIANLLIVGCIGALIWVLWPKLPPPMATGKVNLSSRAVRTDDQAAENPPSPSAPDAVAANDAAAQVAAAIKIVEAQTFVQNLKLGLNRYKIDMGEYPSTADGIQALITPPAGSPNAVQWHGPYVDGNEAVPTDPWGHAYKYSYPGTHAPAGANAFDAWSGGPAGDGSTDLGNW